MGGTPAVPHPGLILLTLKPLLGWYWGGDCHILAGWGGQDPHPGACPQPRRVQPEPVSAQSLMDCILESFAFLNADLASDELSLFGGSQAPE